MHSYLGNLRIPQIPIFLKSIIAVGTFAGIVNINKIEFLVSTILVSTILVSTILVSTILVSNYTSINYTSIKLY